MALPPISNALAKQYPRALVLWLDEQRRAAADASNLTGTITTSNMTINLDTGVITILDSSGLVIGTVGGITVQRSNEPDWELVDSTDALRIELILESFHRMVADAQAGAEPFQDGWRDVLTDESSLDSALSNHQSYNAGDYYEPSAYQDLNQTGGSSALIGPANNKSLGQAITFAEAVSISSLWFRVRREGTPGNGSATVVARIYAASGTIGTSGVPTGAVLATSTGVQANDLQTSLAYQEFTLSSPVALSAGDYVVVVTDTDQTNYDGSNYIIAEYSNTTVHAGNYCAQAADDSWAANSGYDLVFRVELSNSANMTVTFLAYEASGEPAESQAIICIYAVDSITLNTDLIIEVSLDDGANWEQVTMSLYGNYDSSGKQIIDGVKALTDRNDQTTRLRIRTANHKNVQIHMVANLLKLQ